MANLKIVRRTIPGPIRTPDSDSNLTDASDSDGPGAAGRRVRLICVFSLPGFWRTSLAVRKQTLEAPLPDPRTRLAKGDAYAIPSRIVSSDERRAAGERSRFALETFFRECG